MKVSNCTALLPAKRGVGGLDASTDVVRDQGQGFATTLNPHPERVSDVLFQTCVFFDPCDLVQVKYEMLRRVMVEGQQVATTATNFGFSRMTLHHLRKRFETEGMTGLLPRHKGPCRAHKLTEEVLIFVVQTLEAEPDLRTADLPQRVEETFGLSVHGRSIERALARHRKKS
jgi:transposase